MSDIITLDEQQPMDKLVLYVLDEARKKLEKNGGFEPFTVIVRKDDLYEENHPGDDPVTCFNSALLAVKTMSSMADAYLFCYDGFVNLEDGVCDAIIVERASKQDELAQSFALMYDVEEESDEGSISYDEQIYLLGEAPSLFFAEEFTTEQLEDLDEAHEHGHECACSGAHAHITEGEDTSTHDVPKEKDAQAHEHGDDCCCGHN
ncbi:MAG: hypothetical protein LBG97_02865 [Coriobacteriales bacterium]|jgi:hypothetical protein|nr:hypothetical protein [Coriobacteriales bacterium]